MQIKEKYHYDLMAQFEKQFPHRRFDKEPKEIWPIARVYQDGQTNELFLAYRAGAAYGRAIA